MNTRKSILPRLAGLEGNLEEELARLALLRSQGKLPLPDGVRHPNIQTIRTKIDVFRSLTDFSGDCWNWNGPRSDGYGNICVGLKVVRVHRFSFVIFNGRDPEQLVCHHCDNQMCVNPDHFFEGDHHANNMDCALKGRHNDFFVGESHPKAKLTEADALSIFKSELPTKVLAARWGVNVSTINRVRRAETWKHILQNAN